MKRAEASELGPHDWLIRASRAASAASRAKYATRGLSQAGADPALQALLLRQLYLAHLETNRLEVALAIAGQLIETGTLADIAYQDLARAHLGLGDCPSALSALERAWETAPAERRSFHDWTRGCVLYLSGDYSRAVGAFERAASLGTRAPRLLAAQSALAQFAAQGHAESVGQGFDQGSLGRGSLGRGSAGEDVAGQGIDELRQCCERLEGSAAMTGYGGFVAAEVRFVLGDAQRAGELLDAFIARVTAARVARQVALGLELSHARKRLRQLTGGAPLSKA